jgi:hypothetical protein
MNRYQLHVRTGLKWPVCLAVAYLMLAMSGLVVWGQPRSNAVPISNRYLFLVETSRPMQARTEGMLNAMESLLTSGMQGQMHSNDTIGLWTFNQKLYAGKCELLQWTGSTQKTVSAAVTGFLNQQKYEKSPDFAQVFPTLGEVMKNSDFITIVLFSSGESSIHGTAFDDKINKYFKDWRNVQQKAHMPFITVLRAEKGVINDYSMNSAPWPVHLSPLPAELVAAFEAEAKPAAPPPPPKPAGPAAAPLYFSGRKSEPTTGALYFSGPNKIMSVPPTPALATGQSGQAGAPTQSSPALDLGQGGPQPSAHGTALGETSPSGPESHPVLAPTPPPQPHPATQPESPVVTPAPPAPKPQAQPENVSSAPPSAPVAAETHPVSGSPVSSETATAVPAGKAFVGPLIWALPLAGFLVGGCLFLLRRKSQPGSHGSIITRSYDRNQPKP